MSRNMAASEIFEAIFTKNSSHEKSRVLKVFLNTLLGSLSNHDDDAGYDAK